MNLFYGLWTVTIDGLYVSQAVPKVTVVGIFSSCVVGEFLDSTGRRRREEVALGFVELNNTQSSGYFRFPQRHFEINNNTDSDVSFYVREIDSNEFCQSPAHKRRHLNLYCYLSQNDAVEI